MANVRMAGAALLTTVTEVAETATSLITSVGTGAKMLNAFADNAHYEQAKRIAAGKVSFEDNLKVTTAMQIEKSRAAYDEYIVNNPGRKDHIQAIMAELDKALA